MGDRAVGLSVFENLGWQAGGGYTCQRAMGLRNNVIIDALWCGFDTTSEAGQVVSEIAAAVSHT